MQKKKKVESIKKEPFLFMCYIFICIKKNLGINKMLWCVLFKQHESPRHVIFFILNLGQYADRNTQNTWKSFPFCLLFQPEMIIFIWYHLQ